MKGNELMKRKLTSKQIDDLLDKIVTQDFVTNAIEEFKSYQKSKEVNTLLSYDKFLKKLKNNEINDFDKYIQKAPYEYILRLAEKGIEIDKLLTRGELGVIRALINNNHGANYYEMWKLHSDPSIRVALAKNGHFSKFFIKDLNPEVRSAVLDAKPEYIPVLMKRTKIEWKRCYNILINQTHPSIDVLTQFTRYKRKSPPDKELFETKIKSLITEPNETEQNMSSYELYIANNPLWASDVSIKQMKQINRLYETMKRNNHLKIFESIFGQILNTKDYWTMWDIYQEKRNNIKQKRKEF